MKLAIVGSRDYKHEGRIRLFVRNLPADTHIITGGARGVDTIAEEEARYMGMAVTVHMPDWANFEKQAGPIRNAKIIEECDQLVAFWDGKSRGTMNSIGLCKRAGKKFSIIGDAK